MGICRSISTACRKLCSFCSVAASDIMTGAAADAANHCPHRLRESERERQREEAGISREHLDQEEKWRSVLVRTRELACRSRRCRERGRVRTWKCAPVGTTTCAPGAAGDKESPGSCIQEQGRAAGPNARVGCRDRRVLCVEVDTHLEICHRSYDDLVRQRDGAPGLAGLEEETRTPLLSLSLSRNPRSDSEVVCA